MDHGEDDLSETTEDQPRVGTAGDGLEDLVATLTEAGLALPPVPGALRNAVSVHGRWWWGTARVQPWTMYFSDFVDHLRGEWDRAPVFVLSHAGHGANSYFLSLLVADGPVAAFVQHGWGGAYTDPEWAAEEVSRSYGHLHTVIERAASRPGPVRWLAVALGNGTGRVFDLQSTVDPPEELTTEEEMCAALLRRMP